jgi:hypothetical protein
LVEPAVAVVGVAALQAASRAASNKVGSMKRRLDIEETPEGRGAKLT